MLVSCLGKPDFHARRGAALRYHGGCVSAHKVSLTPFSGCRISPRYPAPPGAADPLMKLSPNDHVADLNVPGHAETIEQATNRQKP